MLDSVPYGAAQALADAVPLHSDLKNSGQVGHTEALDVIR